MPAGARDLSFLAIRALVLPFNFVHFFISACLLFFVGCYRLHSPSPCSTVMLVCLW